MASSTIFLKCGKCHQQFNRNENLGSLKCFDRYYTQDRKKEYRIRADHRQNNGTSAKFNILSWEDWVWTFDDNKHIETSIFKKLPYIPDKSAIVDIDEYNRRYRDYMITIEKNDKVDDVIMISTKSELQKPNDSDTDSFFSDDNESESETDDNDLNNDLPSSSVIKTVCVARFDWREKFRVIKEIHTYDSKKSTKRAKTTLAYQKYWETVEYKSNDERRGRFQKARMGLIY